MKGDGAFPPREALSIQAVRTLRHNDASGSEPVGAAPERSVSRKIEFQPAKLPNNEFIPEVGIDDREIQPSGSINKLEKLPDDSPPGSVWISRNN